VKFTVAAALAAAALCVAVVSCASGPAATASTQAPPVTVLTKGEDNGNGDIFLAPRSGDQDRTGPEIVSITGQVLWFGRLPAATFATDFRTQTYRGKPVPTWFQGSGTGGEDVICNARYHQIATVKPANGYLPEIRTTAIGQVVTTFSTNLFQGRGPGAPRRTARARPEALGEAPYTDAGLLVRRSLYSPQTARLSGHVPGVTPLKP
jgi:hypothetical protein